MQLFPRPDVQLKRWRLLRSRDLQIEAYKIFQNRSLCDFVRRKRNDPCFGAITAPEPCEELLAVWGCGPSKIQAESYGPEAVRVLEDAEVVSLLSRSVQDAAAATAALEGRNNDEDPKDQGSQDGAAEAKAGDGSN